MKRIACYGAVLFGFLFSLLAVTVYMHPSFVAIVDAAAHALVIPLQSNFSVDVFLAITNFGSTTGIIVGMLVVAALFLHRPDVVTRLVIALLGSTVSEGYLKTLIARARPETLPGLTRIASYSFPSGHSTESMVLYGFLALLLYVHATRRLEKWLAILFPLLIILLVGLSRMVLDYHYVSDVLGGYLLGAFWICLALALPLSDRVYHWNKNKTEPIDRPLL
jgi:undecaprenyl-diphosphatase